MARIPDAEVERIKVEVEVERLAAGAGVALGRQGDDLIGGCPFCAAADALMVSPAPNLWRCRACGVGGSVIDWVMRAEGVAFRHAVELLRDGHTPTRLEGRPPVRSSVAKLAAPFAPELSNGDLLERVVGFCHQALLEAPDARTYLPERSLADGDAVERFGLGFSVVVVAGPSGTERISVLVPGRGAPVFAQLTPLSFEGLRGRVWSARDGRAGVLYEADAVAAKDGARPKGGS